MSETVSRFDQPRTRTVAASFSLRDIATALFYYKRPVVFAFLVPVLLGIAAGLMAHTTFTAQARLLVLYGSEYVFHPGARDSGSDITLDRNQIIQGELQIIQSPALAAEVLESIGPNLVYPGVDRSDSPLRAAMSRFSSDLITNSIPQSNVVELSYRNANREIAIRVLNALVSHYMTYRLTIFDKAPSEGGVNQRDQFADRLRKAEDTLAKFGLDHGITNLDEQLTLQLRLLTDNQSAQNLTAQQIGETSGELAALRKELTTLPRNVQIYAESARSQQVTGLTDSLVKLQVQRRDLLSRYQADFPLVRDVDRQIAALQAQISGDPARNDSIARTGRNTVYDDEQKQAVVLAAQLQGLEAKQTQLAAERVTLQARYDELAGLSRQYRDLQRTRDLLDQSYRAIALTTEETQLSGALERESGTNVRVVQPADAPLAGRNPAPILYAAGVVLGTLAALAAFTLLNVTRQIFITGRDVEQRLGLPVLLSVSAVTRRAAAPAKPPAKMRAVTRPRFGV